MVTGYKGHIGANVGTTINTNQVVGSKAPTGGEWPSWRASAVAITIAGQNR